MNAIFNLQREYLYAGTICIPASMTSIPAGEMYGINYNESWNMKSQFIIPDFFYLHAIFTLQREFLYAGTISTLACMISIPEGAICIPACTICIPVGTIGTQIRAGNKCREIFLHTRVNILHARINFCDWNFHSWGKLLP